MSDLPEADLEALYEYLLSETSPEHSMLLSDLDGFLTGIVVGPELVPPGEWFPVIWSGEEPAFDSERQMTSVLGTIMARYNEIADTMNTEPDRFEPIIYESPEGYPIVTDWAMGFLDAIKLRRRSWDPLFRHRRAKILLVPIVILGDEDDFFEHHPSPHEMAFYADAPELVRNSVIGIHEFWRNRRPTGQKPRPRRQRTDRVRMQRSPPGRG